MYILRLFFGDLVTREFCRNTFSNSKFSESLKLIICLATFVLPTHCCEPFHYRQTNLRRVKTDCHKHGTKKRSKV